MGLGRERRTTSLRRPGTRLHPLGLKTRMAEGKKRALPTHFAAEKPRPPTPVNRELLSFVPNKHQPAKYKQYTGRYYRNGADRLMQWTGSNGQPVCVTCWGDEDCSKPKQARYEDERRIVKFCAEHSRLAGTHAPQRPCELCTTSNKREAHYPNLQGESNKLCAQHARESGSYMTLNPCRDCPKDSKLEAHYPDQHGAPNKLCARHARETGTLVAQFPCRDCPADDKREAHYKDETGRRNRLCSTHAREAASYEVINPCRDCPPDAKLEASFKDEEGRRKQLCATHAREAGTFVVLNPCRDCLESEKREAMHKDEQGRCKKLCATHAREAGTFVVWNPCRDCLQGDKREARYKDEEGRCHVLCATHARDAGTFVVLNPCRDCPADAKTEANFKDEAGRCRALCAEHAFQAGTKAKFCHGASVMACDCWDRLESYSGIEIPHVHFKPFSSDPPTGSEVTGLIPGRRLRPDGYIHPNQPIHIKGEDSGPKGAVYLFHGEEWHGGWPKEHPKAAPGTVNCQGTPFSKLYDLTLESHRLYKAYGYRVFVVWGQEFKRVRARRFAVSIREVVHEV